MILALLKGCAHLEVIKLGWLSSGFDKAEHPTHLTALTSTDPDVDLPWVMRSGAEITRFGAALSRGPGGLVAVHRVEQRVKYVEIQ
jgi:hypothetical protein